MGCDVLDAFAVDVHFAFVAKFLEIFCARHRLRGSLPGSTLRAFRSPTRSVRNHARSPPISRARLLPRSCSSMARSISTRLVMFDNRTLMRLSNGGYSGILPHASGIMRDRAKGRSSRRSQLLG